MARSTRAPAWDAGAQQTGPTGNAGSINAVCVCDYIQNAPPGSRLKAILVALLGGLGFDLYSRHRMGQLDDAIKRLVDENESASLYDLTRKKIHEEIRREPTRKSEGWQDTEEYDFPGVFYIHRVTVMYRSGKEDRYYDGHKARSVFRIGGEAE